MGFNCTAESKHRFTALTYPLNTLLVLPVEVKSKFTQCCLLSSNKALLAFLARHVKHQFTSPVHYNLITQVPLRMRIAKSKQSRVFLSSLDKLRIVSKESVERRYGEQCYCQYAQVTYKVHAVGGRPPLKDKKPGAYKMRLAPFPFLKAEMKAMTASCLQTKLTGTLDCSNAEIHSLHNRTRK